MIKAKKNKFLRFLFKIYHKTLLKKHFYQINLTGDENFQLLDSSFPVILYANHSNWWDGFIAFQLTSVFLKADDYLMMDIEQMQKYRFFKYVGVFSVNRNEAREGVESINYAADILKEKHSYLWIFPQGVMQVQDFKPLKFYTGITRIAEKTGHVNLLPVSIRYEFIMEQRPEVFIKIGKPRIVNESIADVKNFTEQLQEELSHDLEKLKSDVVNKDFPGYKVIFKGKHSRNKTVDRFYTK